MISLELTNLSIIFAVTVLLMGSWQDVRSREVIDLIWYLIIAGGVVTHIVQIMLLILAGSPPDHYFFSWLCNIGLGIFLTLFLTVSGLGGEADRIAFLSLAIISPVDLPLVFLNVPKYNLISSITPNILGTFFNAYLITIPVPIFIFLYNLLNQLINRHSYRFNNEGLFSTLFIRFIGYPRSTDNLHTLLELNPWHFDFLENYSEESGWKISFRLQLDTPEADIERKKRVLEKINVTEKAQIWIQPTFPFILLITLGFIINVLWGNIIFLFVSIIT